MAVPTLAGISLTGCKSIGNSKKGNLIPLPMPTGDSDETEVFDMLGVTRTLNITGDFSESTIAATKAIIDQIEALVDGDQSLNVDFVSDQTGTISAKVDSISSDWEVQSNGFKCSYVIKIFQGAE